MSSVNPREEKRPDVSGQFAAPETDPMGRTAMVGLVGILVAFVAIGTLFALQQPPFVGADEKAHLGYAHDVANGSLPTIDERPTIPIWADQWMMESIYTQVDANRTIWVANHPPLFYVSVAPLVWYSEITHRPDGGLLLLRFANIAYGAIGVAFTYAIALELTRSRRIALVSTGVVAMTTQLYASLSLAMSDGMTFAAGAAVTWAGLRCLQRGTTSRNLTLLAVTTAVATGARAVTMLVAFAVVGVVAAVEFMNSRAATRDRWRAAGRVCLVGVLPAALLFGWFYLRNIAIYGDIGASSYLLERFDRETNGSILSTLLDGPLWRSLYARSMSPFTYRGPRPPGMWIVATLGIAGLVLATVTRCTGDRDAAGNRYQLARRSILLLLLGVAVIVLYIAQHVSGGGYLHPRYAFPVLASVATLLVVGLDRILPRVLPVALLVAMGLWTLIQLPVGVDPATFSRPRDGNRLAPVALRTLPGSEWWRTFSALWIVVGFVVAAAAITTVVFAPRTRPPVLDELLTGDDAVSTPAGRVG